MCLLLQEKSSIEQFGIAAILTESVRGFPQSFQANVSILSRLGHYSFLPDIFFFLIPPFYFALCRPNTDSIVIYATKEIL
jgi:hypothetical protein